MVLMTMQTAAAVDVKPEKIRLQLKWFHQFQFAGYYMALEKGFYRDAGLDVEILEGRPYLQNSAENSHDQILVDNMLAGHADYTIVSSGVILEYIAGKPVVALAAVVQNSPGVLLVRGDSEIHTPLDFAGKRLMLQGSAESLALLHKEGIDLSKVNIQPEHSGINIDDLINGRSDVYFGYVSNEVYQLQKAGVDYRQIIPRDYGVNFYNDVLITSQYKLHKHPAQVASFVRASMLGWEYALTHIDETCQLIQQRYAPGKTLDALRFEAASLHKLIMPELVQIGHMNPERWWRIGETYAELGMMPAQFNLEGLLYQPNPPAKSLFWLYLGLAGVLAIIVVIGTVCVYIFTINRRLTKSLSLLEATLESTTDAILVVDLSDKLALYNQQFLVLWQIDFPIAINMYDSEILARAVDRVVDAERFLARVDEIYAAAELSSFDVIHFKDGRIIERYSMPQRIGDDVVGRVWSFRDISARIASERLLIESQRRFADIVESAMDAIITINVAQKIVLFNPGAEKMFGCPAEAAIGATLDRFIPEHYRHAHSDYIQGFGISEIPSAKMAGVRIVIGLRANGEEFPLEVTISQSGKNAEKIYTAIIRDISERIRVQQTLKASQQENQLLAELICNSTQPIGVGGADGSVALVNNAFETLTGYSAAELYAINWATELTPPEWFEFEQAKLAELHNSGQAVRYEKEYICKNGNRVPVELLVNYKAGSEDQPELYYAFVTDISERKRVEAATRESEQRMLLATEATGVGIWEWELESNLLRWDAQMFRIYGITPTPDGIVPYTTWSEAVLAEDLPDQEAIIQNTIRQLGLSSREFRILRGDDGQCRYIRAVETVRRNKAGEAIAVVGTNLDVTEATLAATGLRESEQRWRFCLEVASMGAWELNCADKSHWRSLGHAQIFGYQELPTEWSYEIILQHVLDEDRARVDQCIRQARAEYQGWSIECRIRRVDGEIRWLWVRAEYLIQQDDRGYREFGLMSDVTERKRAEQDLLDADQHKDNFLAMLAHELRNPLAPISNALEIQKMAPADPARVLWSADIIDRQIKHLTVLVDDLLDVSRINRDLIELKQVRLEMREFINTAVETCQPLLEARQQKFVLNLPAEPVWLQGDSVRLAQVVANLLNNAIKFTQEGGNIELKVEASADDICIRVIDNGYGVDGADLPKLFQLFYQVDRSLHRTQGGLGIGLSLVQRLVEKHGGTVQAFSAGSGQGSEFVVHLPRLMVADVPAIVSPVKKAPTHDKLRILLVDDNRDVADSMAMLMRLDRHQVTIANDGQVGLETARAERPDVIVLDIGLPVMDGYAVAQAIRQEPELANALLIALTGYGRAEDREKAKIAGFDEFMVKPPDIKQLRKLLTDQQEKLSLAR